MTASKCDNEKFARMWAEGFTLVQLRDHFGYASTGSVSGVVARLSFDKDKMIYRKFEE